MGWETTGMGWETTGWGGRLQGWGGRLQGWGGRLQGWGVEDVVLVDRRGGAVIVGDRRYKL